MKREIIPVFVISLIILAAIVSATTASIGNSRMILHLSPSESVDKYILVKNVNDFPVNITLTAEGDLKDNIKIKDTSFTLQANEEKNAYFTIKAQKSGTSESKINVLFKPEEGNTVGLVSTIIVTVGGADISTSGDASSGDASTDNSSDSGVTFNINNKTSVPENSTNKSSLSLSPALMLSISTLVLAAILVILFFYASKKMKKSGSIKPKKSVPKSEA